MKKKVHKRSQVFIIIIAIIIGVVLLLFLDYLKSERINQYKDQHIRELEVSYNSIINIYRLVSETVFDEAVNKPDVLTIIANALHATGKEREKYRNELFDELDPVYTRLKKRNVRQLHFHFTDCTSFLRFHRPEIFGDNLKDIRYSVKTANLEKSVKIGFEEGRIINGFRYVFPLFYMNEHIGTVETSVSFAAISKLLEEVNHGEYLLLISKDIVDEKIFIDEKPNYTSSVFTKQYLHEKSLLEEVSAECRELNLGLIGKVERKLGKREGFTVAQSKNGINFLVSFFPIKNVEGEHAAFIVSYKRDDMIGRFETSFIYHALTIELLLLTITLFGIREMRSRIKLQQAKNTLERTNRKLEIHRMNLEEEVTKKSAQLVRAQRMEAIGLMAGGVVHDLNNILSGIINYPEILLLKLPENSELRKPIKAIQGAGNRAAAILDDLLSLTRGATSIKKIASLNDLVNEYLNSPEFKKLGTLYTNIVFSTQLDSELLNISCTPVHVTKCIMNLVANAAESIPTKGNVTISTYNLYLDTPFDKNQYMEVGEYAVLSVVDTGSGISKNDLEHIFDPFYTRKEMGRSGTGLGLAIVWNTVHSYGGGVMVESNEEGSTFMLYFPIVREDLSAQEVSLQLESIKGRGESILIIDDETIQREIAGKILRLLGYQTAYAESGEKAMEYLKKQSIDLLLLDMIMPPGMNGRQTYENIIGVHPRQKAIIASGFALNEDVEATLQLGAGLFVKKPYTIQQLGQAVQEVLKR